MKKWWIQSLSFGEAFLCTFVLMRSKRLNLLMAIFFATILSGCKQQQRSPARIFERKHVDSNRLMIKYEFWTNGTNYSDSVIIENHVLPGDSITVVFDKNHPQKSSPEFLK